MAGTSPRRMEPRTALELFVELCSLDNATFEITSTLDVSPHGARVLSDSTWVCNQRLSVRMVGSSRNSPAHIVYCRPYDGEKYVVGLKIQEPAPRWPRTRQMHR